MLEPTPEQLSTRGRVNTHHGYWTKTSYHSNSLHAIFRNLITNVYPLLTEEHAVLHANYDPPVRPKDSLMYDVIEEYLAINGTIDCVREKKTAEVYKIQAVEWQHLQNNGKVSRI